MAKRRIKPITPDHVVREQKNAFPNEVFEAFNELISRECVGGDGVIKQSDVVALMVKKGLKRKDIFDNGWLNVESIYQSAGWKVEYEKPGFNETFEANFTFRRSSH